MVKIGRRGVITLPKKLRNNLGIIEGGVLNVFEKKGSIILKPNGKGDDIILASIRKSLDDLRRGAYIEFGSITEFEKKLKAYNDD